MTLSSVAGVLTEVGLAVGTVVVRVHAVIHAEGDEAAPEVAPDEADHEAGDPGHFRGRGLGGGVDLVVAVRADHVSRLRTQRHDGGHNGRGGLLRDEWLLLLLLLHMHLGIHLRLGDERGLRGYTPHSLGITGGSRWGRGGTEANRGLRSL